MNGCAPIPSFFIGWDVGGWNCDRNPRSRDALVILDSERAFVGKPWRGNLRTHINETSTTGDWIWKLFNLCAAVPPGRSVQITMAIDTPLGFSEEFVRLVVDLNYAEPVGSSDTNSYLFRRTERHLFEQGLSPLSAIKDMIGSQSTKGMHVLAKFAPYYESCGVWTDGKGFSAIETYPAACNNSQMMKDMLKDQKPLNADDLEDAWICALVAYVFVKDRSALEPPGDNVPPREGWIWMPRDVFGAQEYKR